MTLNRQKAIFERAEIIAGVNGAAFANALFRYDKPLAVGALISANWLSTTFPTMAKVFGFSYAGLVIPPVGDDLGAALLVPPDTAKRPSGVTPTALTQLSCPPYRLRRLRLLKSQTPTCPS